MPKGRIAEHSVADWIHAAEQLLAENGSRAFEITTVCKRLGFSRGSFYWHFKMRDELKMLVLENWRRANKIDVCAEASRIDASSSAAFEHVSWGIENPQDTKSAAIERAIRDWVTVDERARTVVAEVDQSRLALLRRLLGQRCPSEQNASTRVYAAYAIITGFSVLKQTGDPRYQVDVKQLVDLLLNEERSGTDLVATREIDCGAI